jgi:hypothetical protein
MSIRLAVLIILVVAVILAISVMRVPQTEHGGSSHTTSSSKELSVGRDAIFIGDGAPAYALLKMKDKIYALGGGVAVIFSEDLSPLCYAKLKYNIWKAENYDEERFVSMQKWYPPTRVGSIAMFDSELNLIWSVDGNFTDFRVVNNKIYAIEFKGNYYYLDIFDGNGNLIRSFRVLDANEVTEWIRDSLTIEVNDKIYVPYVSGDSKPYKLMLLSFDEQGNLELEKEIYETEEDVGRTYIYSYRDSFLLTIEGPACRYIYVDRNGSILRESIWEPLFETGFRNCWTRAKVVNNRVYVFGHDECIFAGLIGIIETPTPDSPSFKNIQEIFVKRDSTWQDNSIIYDILPDGDELYVIGLVQMNLPSGAFIVRVDPNIDTEISPLLERADVIYLEDIPPCKS